MKMSTILVVDDEQANRLLLSEMLDTYHVLLAHNGDSMREILDKNNVDLILLDVMMPEEDGFTLAKELQQNTRFKHIPIIYVTAKISGNDIDEGFKSGAIDYIKKPFNINELENRVKKALSDSSNKKELTAQVVSSQMVFEQSLDGIILLSNEFVIQSVNPTCNAFLGYNKHELENTPIADLLHNQQGYTFPINQLIKKTSDIWLLHKNESLLPVRFTFSQITDKDENEIGWACTFQDIKQQKDTELNLLKAKEKAEEAEKLKSSFLANLSHEVRTPLNAILGFADLLEDSNITLDEKKEFISIIKNNGEKLLSIIERLLDKSSIDSQKITIHKQDSNIKQLCIDLQNECKKLQTNNNITFTCLSNLTPNFTFKTDSKRLFQALYNLLENAFKFTKKGQILFSCNINNNMLEFNIQDSGIGIPKEHLDSLFSSFKKINSPNEVVSGIGLGLSIAKNLIELLDGSISVESKINEGTCFTVIFAL